MDQIQTHSLTEWVLFLGEFQAIGVLNTWDITGVKIIQKSRLSVKLRPKSQTRQPRQALLCQNCSADNFRLTCVMLEVIKLNTKIALLLSFSTVALLMSQRDCLVVDEEDAVRHGEYF